MLPTLSTMAGLTNNKAVARARSRVGVSSTADSNINVMLRDESKRVDEILLSLDEDDDLRFLDVHHVPSLDGFLVLGRAMAFDFGDDFALHGIAEGNDVLLGELRAVDTRHVEAGGKILGVCD